jgi:hypothetical protein
MALQSDNNTRGSMDQYYSAKVTELREVSAESWYTSFNLQWYLAISHFMLYCFRRYKSDKPIYSASRHAAMN